MGPGEVELRFGSESERAPRQPFGGRWIRQRHYFPEFARKPQAVRQNAHLIVAELGESFGELWRLLVDRHGPRDAARRMARVLAWIVDEGEERVRARVSRAIESDALDALLLERGTPAARAEVSVPPGLERFVVEAARATDDDALLGGDHDG